MYLIGIDQSLTATGIAVIDGAGALLASKVLKTGSLRGAARLAHIRDELRGLLMCFPPKYAAIEGYSIESVNRPFDLGEVGGLVRLTLYDAHVPTVVVAPKQLKKFVTGSGDATKEKVQLAVSRKWGIVLSDDNAADALGLAHIARLMITNNSTRREELEVIKTLTTTTKIRSAGDKVTRMLSV